MRNPKTGQRLKADLDSLLVGKIVQALRVMRCIQNSKYLYRIIFIFFGSERDEGVASAYFPEEKI